MAITRKDLSIITPAILKERAFILESEKRVEQKAQEIKNEILKEFEDHPVTQELKGGIYASNISGTLNGITNLFSFIGFRSGYDPIEPIMQILNKINIVKNRSSQSIKYKIEIPTAEDIFAVTPLPWAEGRSWAKGIETGISGIGYYFKKESQSSRSGSGIQSQTKVRDGVRFKNVKYISELIKKYNRQISRLEK